MSKLKVLRQLQNLTQEELYKSGISVRTIQRIETGKEPKDIRYGFWQSVSSSRK
jgi:transcriptional regulator with XRE-family HTH domain